MKTGRTIRHLTFALGLVSIFALQTFICSAGPGALDTTFGHGTGMVRTGFGGGFAQCNAAAVQSDGKLILAGSSDWKFVGNGIPGLSGDFVLARFNTNGVPDTSFGDHGKVVTQVSTNYLGFFSSSITAIAIQPDDKIVVGGYCFHNTNYTEFTLARYNTDGSLDTSFGLNGTGIVYTDLGVESQITGLSFQFGTNLIAVGTIFNNHNADGFALAGYTMDGVLIPSFGSGGLATTPGTRYAANAVLVTGDGTIYAAGQGIGPGYPSVGFALFHYTTNGLLDTSFTGGGQVFALGFGYFGSAAAIALQNGDPILSIPAKIVVGGTYTDNNLAYYQAVIRYNLDGTLDTSFGNGGITTNVVGAALSASCTGLNVQGAELGPRKITFGGWANDGANEYFTVARLTSTGAFDTTFGTGSSGKTTFKVLNDDVGAEVNAMAVLQSGDFVVAGSRSPLGDAGTEFAAVGFTSSGAVDGTFGASGLLLADVSDADAAPANGVAIQQDGKIVLAGATPPYYNLLQNTSESRFALARFNTDGTLDDSFGVNGKVATVLGTNDQAYVVAIQADGKIVAAGATGTGGKEEFGLVRYNSDGSLDGNFGFNGTVTALVGSGDDQARALEIQPDGKIVVAGYADNAGTGPRFAMERFSTNGTLDTTFGIGGTVLTSITETDLAYSAAIQADGKIVLGGGTSSSSDMDFAAVRYTTNGAVDTSFGFLGRATENAGGITLDTAFAVAIQPDGKILLAGGAGFGIPPGTNAGGDVYVALMRFNTNGALDTSFGSDGFVLTQIGAENNDYATAVAVQSDGKIILAGATQDGPFHFFAERFNPDGSVDNSYGDGGISLLDFGTGTGVDEIPNGLVLDSQGRAVLAGSAGGLFGIARLQADMRPLLNIFLTATNTAVVTWPFPSTGWVLQQDTDLFNGSWGAPSQTINNDGTNNFIVVAPPVGNSFYRLVEP